MMTPAQHYASACRMLEFADAATADADGEADNPAVLYALRSATTHALLARPPLCACCGAAAAMDYAPNTPGVRHITDPDSVETGVAW